MNTIKELKDLEAVRESMQSKINLRRHHEGPQVIISAGEYEEGGLARQLVAAFLEEAAKAYGKSVYGRHLKKVAAGEIVNSPREY